MPVAVRMAYVHNGRAEMIAGRSHPRTILILFTVQNRDHHASILNVIRWPPFSETPVELVQQHILDLTQGKTVTAPRYNMKTGYRGI